MVFNPELMFSLLKVQIEYYVKEISLPYTENLRVQAKSKSLSNFRGIQPKHTNAVIILNRGRAEMKSGRRDWIVNQVSASETKTYRKFIRSLPFDILENKYHLLSAFSFKTKQSRTSLNLSFT